jgi:hypothetical protein
MMSWIWDATDETNRMKSDPYADIRQQRARAEKAEEISSLLLENLKDARRLLSDQEEIDLVYLDEVIAKAEEPS